MTKAVLGIIGGSGVYALPGLTDIRERAIMSPWGEPSDTLRAGVLHGREIIFLARHGQGHRLSPSGINYRANVDCMKRAGVTDLISLSAVGSFSDEMPPGQFVLPGQYVDRTFRREPSFFGNGCVAHVSMAHPVGPTLQDRIVRAAQAEQIDMRKGGTLVVIEGPQFSSHAESIAYRAQGFDLIGMTAMPEAKLAREAEITYATVAMVTDFDCWHPGHDAVDVKSVVAVMHANTQKAGRLVARLAAEFPLEREPCPAGSHNALDHAIMTAPDARDPVLMKKLDAVMARLVTN